MTQAKRTSERATVPSIRDLTLRFLERSEASPSVFAIAPFGEVEPHEVSVAFHAEPRQAWLDGLRALGAASYSVKTNPPSDWATLLANQAPAADLPLAAGNHPQRVRDLNALLQAKDLSTFREGTPHSTAASITLKNWASRHAREGDFAQALVAGGVLRAAGDFEAAAAVLSDLRVRASAKEQAVLANEEAALLWQRGEWERAAANWQGLPESVVVLFNRGMAALFLNQRAEARGSLRKAIAGLPEDDTWHHLASLYLALAEIRA